MSISPELALAAAAAIGDKALHEQTKELLELRRQLAESRKVEVTSRGGSTVYAVGQFEDGILVISFETNPFFYENFMGSNQNSNNCNYMWNVQMTMCEGEEIPPLPLNELQNIEIRLGGIVYATADEVKGENVRDSQGRTVSIPFDGFQGGNRAFLSLGLIDMPEPPWMMLKSAVTYNRNQILQNEEDLIDIFHMMTDSRQLPQRLPNQKVDILCVAFHRSSVGSMLKRLREQRAAT